MHSAERDSGNRLLLDYFEDLLQEPDLKVVYTGIEGVHAEDLPPDTVESATEETQSLPDGAAADDVPTEDSEVTSGAPVQENMGGVPRLALEWPPALERWREQERHDCLLLTLAGITLAMPLCCVDLPKPWPEGVRELDDSVFQGLYRQAEGVSRAVVHLAEIVMPGKGIPFREGIVVPMLDLPWSLRVDDLQGTRSYSSAELNWNRAGGKRPWLAAMVKGQPVAMMDPLELARLLAERWKEKLA